MFAFLYNPYFASISLPSTTSLCCLQAQHHEPLLSAWYEVVGSGYANTTYISPAVGVATADAKRKAL